MAGEVSSSDERAGNCAGRAMTSAEFRAKDSSSKCAAMVSNWLKETVGAFVDFLLRRSSEHRSASPHPFRLPGHQVNQHRGNRTTHGGKAVGVYHTQIQVYVS
jgi:hypothetical protein